MTLRGASRYDGATVLQVADEEGVHRPTLYGRVKRIRFPRFGYHTVTEGQRLDTLAHAYFKDSTLWWRIADVNPEYFDPTDMLEPGSVIRIPAL